MRTSALIALAVLLGAPAPAIPPPPPTHARYGPLLLCGTRFSIAVSEGESGSYMLPYSASLHTDAYSLLVTEHAQWAERMRRTRTVTIPGFGTARRFRSIEWPGGRRLGWSYIFPAATGGAFVITSDQFNATQSDFAMLNRIRLGTPDPACAIPVWEDPAFRAREPINELWSPVRHAGPFFHCQGGIGFRVEAGETLQLPWRHNGLTSSELRIGSVPILVDGPHRRWTGGERVFAHPNATRLQLLELSNAPGRWIAVIRPAPHDEGQASERQLAVSFPSESGAGAGLTFLHRLEAVAPDDRRCAERPGAARQ